MLNLTGKFAIGSLVEVLPKDAFETDRVLASDETVCAVLATLQDLVKEDSRTTRSENSNTRVTRIKTRMCKRRSRKRKQNL